MSLRTSSFMLWSDPKATAILDTTGYALKKGTFPRMRFQVSTVRDADWQRNASQRTFKDEAGLEKMSRFWRRSAFF